MPLPRLTYITITTWPDGDVITENCALDRESAFDASEERFVTDLCQVRVVCIEMSDRGAPVGVSDATAIFFAERGIDPERMELCSACHRWECACDAAYEQRVSDALHGVAAE